MIRESEKTAEVCIVDLETGEKVSLGFAEIDLSSFRSVTIAELARAFDLMPNDIVSDSVQNIDVGFFFEDTNGECYYLSNEDITELKKEEKE